LVSHPHVIEPIKYLTSSITGKKSVVAYSMGNIISNQRFETFDKTPKDRYSEDGIIVKLKYKKALRIIL